MRYLEAETLAKGRALSVLVESFNHGHDKYGNGTARYAVSFFAGAECIGVLYSGARRVQVGYGKGHAGAIIALKNLGYALDLSGAHDDDYKGTASYPVIQPGAKLGALTVELTL